MKKKKIAKKNGRPSKKESIDLARVIKLSIAGCTQPQIAIACDISLPTIKNYMKSDPKFLSAIKDNAKLADAMVKRSLWERAIGYEYDEVTREPEKVYKYQDGQIVSKETGELIVTKIVTKKVAPSEVAQIFWLCNRDPENWKRGDRESHREDLVDEEIELIPTNGKSKEMHSRISRFLN